MYLTGKETATTPPGFDVDDAVVVFEEKETPTSAALYRAETREKKAKKKPQKQKKHNY